MPYPISDRASKATENFVYIKNMIRLADQLNIDGSNKEVGVSAHERVHLIDLLRRRLKEIEKILDEEVR